MSLKTQHDYAASSTTPCIAVFQIYLRAAFKGSRGNSNVTLGKLSNSQIPVPKELSLRNGILLFTKVKQFIIKTEEQ